MVECYKISEPYFKIQSSKLRPQIPDLLLLRLTLMAASLLSAVVVLATSNDT